jgi:CheY-like chemotaxis protein
MPNLILSDVMMPELDGYGLLEALRADPLTAAIPFIF